MLEWNLPFAKWFVGGKLNVAVNCVDRHVDAGLGDRVAFHWEGEPGDTRTITYADLLDHGEPGRQRADRARRAGRGQGGHLHADDPRDRRGHAGLCPARRAAHGGLRRLLGRRAAGPDPRLRRPLRHHRRRRLPPRRRRARSSRRSTRRCRSAPTSRHVLVVRRTGQEVAWDDGRDVWWHDLVPRQTETHEARGLRRRAPALHHVHQRDDGQAQGHPAHQRRLPDPRLGHPPAHLRHQARDRRLLDRGRHRLGDRAQLHRLRPAGQRHHLGHVRGHARHARRGPLVAASSRSTRSTSSTPRRPPSAPS